MFQKIESAQFNFKFNKSCVDHLFENVKSQNASTTIQSRRRHEFSSDLSTSWKDRTFIEERGTIPTNFNFWSQNFDSKFFLDP